MIYKKPVLFVIGHSLSMLIEKMSSQIGQNTQIVFVGTDETELRTFSSGKKLIVNEGIRDFYIDETILYLNQTEFDNLEKAITYLISGTKNLFVLFSLSDPLSLAITPILAQSAGRSKCDPSFIAVNMNNGLSHDEKIANENINYFLKNRYRLYLIEKEENNFSLQANEEKSNSELLDELINSLVKNLKQAETI
jgi:hypothetical protein